MIRTVVYGTGRMGAAVVEAARHSDHVSIVATVGPERPEWKSAIPWHPSLDELPDTPELLIDFTLPEGTRKAVGWCADHRVALLSGVTGIPADIRSELKRAATVIPVLWSPNLSLGINLLADLSARAGSVLDADTSVVVEDIHHQWKKDAPSGTALMLGERIADERGGDTSGIEYRSIREGEVIGEHTVTFRLQGEELDLVHRAHDRGIFARGALNAGRWLVGQPPGYYQAKDWLSGV